MWVYCDGSTRISYTIPQFTYQQDGGPPHFHHYICGYLNDTLPHRWIGHASQDDSSSMAFKFTWPNPVRLFLWGYVKDHVFVPPMPLYLAELRQRIEHAVAGIDHQMLVRVGQELDYRIDVCRVTNGGYMEHLWSMYRNFERYSILWHKTFLHVCHGYRSTDTPEGLLTCPVFMQDYSYAWLKKQALNFNLNCFCY